MTEQLMLFGLDPDKYIVITEKDEELAPDEFFVLRRGDALAISTLRSYAANAMTILDLHKMGLVELDSHQWKHLSALADDVSDLAHKWEHDSELKLPS